MTLDTTHPALDDLRKSARKRIPYFVWEYLDSATGDEATQHRNRSALDNVLLKPSILHGEFTPDLSTTLMGRTYPLPFGIAPIVKGSESRDVLAASYDSCTGSGLGKHCHTK